MPFLNLIILCSRYIFLGFSVVFICVAFSFMKPFISYTLGKSKQKNTLLFLCIIFFHIGATGILLAQVSEGGAKDLLINSISVLAMITVARWIIIGAKHQEQLILWHLIFFLLDVGYIMLQRLDDYQASRQVRWIGIGLVFALILPYLFRWLIQIKYKWLYFALTLIFVSLPFFFGKRIYGAINWVQIGPISFQPSEFAKIPFVMYLASFFASKGHDKIKIKDLIEVGVSTLIIMLILVAQKDLGASLLYFLLFLMIAYMGTERLIIPLIGIVAGSLGGILGYHLFSHVRVRVEAWLDPWADFAGNGYQVIQGLFAMGTWGWLGSGLTRGAPQQIPIVTTDYIFPAICEEFGNSFGVVIIFCYLGIVLQGLKIALIQKDYFSKMMVTGLTSIIGLQAFIILGGVLRVIPLTGITLPFVSYGGSSILTSLSIIGLIGCLLATTLKQAREEGEMNED